MNLHDRLWILPVPPATPPKMHLPEPITLPNLRTPKGETPSYRPRSAGVWKRVRGLSILGVYLSTCCTLYRWLSSEKILVLLWLSVFIRY